MGAFSGTIGAIDGTSTGTTCTRKTNILFHARNGETDTSGNLKTSEHLEYGSHNETTVKNSTIRLWKRVS